MSGRRAAKPGDPMNRLYALECRYTVTGGMADHRLRVHASQIMKVAVALAKEIVATLTGDAALKAAAAAVKLTATYAPAGRLRPVDRGGGEGPGREQGRAGHGPRRAAAAGRGASARGRHQSGARRVHQGAKARHSRPSNCCSRRRSRPAHWPTWPGRKRQGGDHTGDRSARRPVL